MKVKSSSSNRVKKCSVMYNGNMPDIRKYVTHTKSLHKNTEGNCIADGRIFLEQLQDGTECINYPTITDRGPVSFSLLDIEMFEDLSQDDRREIVRDHWTVYKQDLR